MSNKLHFYPDFPVVHNILLLYLRFASRKEKTLLQIEENGFSRMEEDFELETADFVNDQNKDGFEVPLGENEDPASDDDMGKSVINQLLF